MSSNQMLNKMSRLKTGKNAYKSNGNHSSLKWPRYSWALSLLTQFSGYGEQELNVHN
jgi:hypothetical protein